MASRTTLLPTNLLQPHFERLVFIQPDLFLNVGHTIDGVYDYAYPMSDSVYATVYE